MAITNFIPQIWSARLLAKLQASLVYGQPGVINRDYEGEIRQRGDTVKITQIGAIAVGDYTKNQDMDAPQILDDEALVLTITESKYFHFYVDDVDRVQAAGELMDQAMEQAAYALRNAADRFIASNYVDIGNKLGDDTAPLQPTAKTAYDMLVDLAVKLDENNVPEEGRWVIVPPWYHGLLLKDERFVASGSAAADDRLRNGRVGEVAGMTVLRSNNVPNSDGKAYKIIAGHQIGWSYAEQVNQVEAYRPERRFGDAVKGLHLYGAKVIRPEALAVLVADRPAESGGSNPELPA